MSMKEKMHGAVSVVSLKGDLMGEPETGQLRDKIKSIITSGTTQIVLDLSGVRYVSSTGLGTLIAGLTTVKNKGGDMRLAAVTEKVESLFVITQLVKVFKEYETVERAVESFK